MAWRGKDPVRVANMQGVGPTGAVEGTAVAHAFAAFYRRHHHAVLAFAVRRIEDQETAREVALDVFRVAWARFSVEEEEPTRAWLLGVARHRIGDAYRQRERDRRLRSALEAEAVTAGPGGSGDRVSAVLADLAPAAREVLILTYWDGLPAAEVGRLLGCSTGAVWVRLHRARAAFAAAWAEEEER